MNPPNPEAEPAGAAKPEPADAPLGAGFDFTDPNSPLAPYYLRASHVVAAGLLAFALLYLSAQPLVHPAVWGHLALGRWTAEHGSLPHGDPFTPFAAPDRPVSSSWLTEVGYHALYRVGEMLAGGDEKRRMAGGVEMLRVGHALLAVASLAVLLIAFRRVSASMPLACAGIALIFLLTLLTSSVQSPRVVGEFFFACLLLALSRPVLSRRAVLGVPLLMAVWANMHWSFTLGLAVLAVFLIGRLVEAGWADVPGRRLLLALALSVGTTMLNPSGPRLYADLWQLARDPNTATLNGWQSVDFRLGLWMHWLFLVPLILLIVSQALSPRPLTVAQVLLAVGFALAACVWRGMLAWWVAIAHWLALSEWPAIRERFGIAGYQSVLSFRKTLVAGLLIVVSLIWSSPVQWLMRGHPPALERIVSRGTPWRLAEELRGEEDPGQWLPDLAQGLQKHYPGGQFEGRILASETLGGFLVWALPADRMPVLAYMQPHLFSADHWDDVLNALAGGPGWWEVLDRYRVNLVVLERGADAKLADFLDKDSAWQVVRNENESAGRSPGGSLFIALRKEPLRQPNVRKREQR
ncbi:MAG: hypothetical protein HYS12_04775 [Planctomycetes bacterium]|nr:hypothetical protein [Planctomycetota bacterium]